MRTSRSLIVALAVTCVFLLPGIVYAHPTGGLVAYYPFNGNADDESGNGHDGTVSGATLTEDRFGTANSAYRLYGTGEYIEVAHTPDLNFGTGDFSVSFWVNTADSNQLQSAFSKGHMPDQGKYWMRINDYKSGGELSFRTADGAGQATHLITNEASITDGAWHHIVSIRRGSDLELYLDGDPLDSISGDVRNVDSSSPFYIGAFRDASDNIEKVLVGVIDDIFIYNRALTETEIEELYSAQPPPDFDLKKFKIRYNKETGKTVIKMRAVGILSEFPFIGETVDAKVTVELGDQVIMSEEVEMDVKNQPNVILIKKQK